MQSDSDIAGYLLKAIAFLAAVTALYVGWKVLPYYLTSLQFAHDMKSHARILSGREELTEALQDVIYQEAQRKGLPIQRDDIQVEYDPSGSRVSVDYTVIADLGFLQLPLHFHLHYSQRKQTFPAPELELLSIIGFVVGLYWFFKGFGIFRDYRVLADTPSGPIRSVAMGRVQVHGRAIGEKTLLSPVSNQACFLYQVQIDRFLAQRKSQGGWDPFLTDMGSVRFYLEDDTGKVLVDPQGAELDLEEAYQCKVRSPEIVPLDVPWRSEAPAPRPPGVPTSESELQRYVTRVAEGVNTAALQATDPASSLEAGSRQREWRRRGGGSFGFLRGLLVLIQFSRRGSDSPPGAYRLTEYCVVPEGEYDITGTCTINRRPGNQLDPQLITQGKNDTVFLISDKAEKTLEQELHSRAWRHIIGGGLLAVGAAAVLLEAMELLV